MTLFNVNWNLDLEARSPAEAVITARDWLRHAGSDWLFGVKHSDDENGEHELFDTADIWTESSQHCVFSWELYTEARPNLPYHDWVEQNLAADRKAQAEENPGAWTCPACRSHSVQGRSITVDGTEITQAMDCPDCGASWINQYVRTGYTNLET